MRNKALFILCDFSDNLSASDNKLSKIIKDNKLIQIMNKPTRVTATSSTLLDITNKSEIIKSWDVVPHEIGDHKLIILLLTLQNLRDRLLFDHFVISETIPKTLFYI